MKLLVLLLAPVLYAQVPGLVTVQAGALSCGAVMRSATTIQPYCYGPGQPLSLVCNSLKTVSGGVFADCHYCPTPGVAVLVGNVLTVPPCPVAESAITWEFAIVANGIAYQYTVDAQTLVSDVLTKVYGTP